MKNYKTAVDILKDIHRIAYLKRIGEYQEPTPRENTEKVLNCGICGKSFVSRHHRNLNCPACNPQRDIQVIVRRAKKWEPLLREHFKQEIFLKEDVSRFFQYEYSTHTIRRTLLAMSRHGSLRLLPGNKGDDQYGANRYVFSNQSVSELRRSVDGSPSGADS